MADIQTLSSGLTVELRTPEGSVFSGGVAKVVTVPGAKGPMGILPRHAALVSSLTMGVTRLFDKAGTEWRFVTGEGFLEIKDNQVLMLVDTAEDVTEIDVSRAESASRRARERLAKPGSDLDRARAESSLLRARMRLSAAGR